jgi:hypothetical protein
MIGQSQFGSVLPDHILIAPTGFENSWNICSENSDAPDVEMIHDLVTILQTYTNVDPAKIRILGSSNGAGLANRIFIENTNKGIDIVCAIVSHLNDFQYHSGNFYKPSDQTNANKSYCGYDVVANPLTTRKYLSISNANDPLIPYAGGPSNVGANFLPAETAAFNIATHKGYMGNILTSGKVTGSAPNEITEFSYLSGDVVHIKGNAGHQANATQKNYIKDYFSKASAPLTVPGSPTGVTATAGNAQATVSFTAPTTNGGSAITRYTVTSNPGNITGTGTSSPITVSGLTNGTSYTFTVVATNAIGNSAPSAPSVAVTPSAPATTNGILTIDFALAAKPPKDLLGVNIGPLTSVKGYQEAGVRTIRTHDFYGPCDYWHYTVNALDSVTQRFRTTFDPTKESSYQWKETDAKMDSIIRPGFLPFFRLGISYPNQSSVPTYPPLDATGQGFQTFAEISRRTAMHYTKGWNNGFNYPIRYWEIWNEPDFKEKFWSGTQGTPINFFNLYKSASLAVKGVEPQFKVGGPGLSYGSLFFRNQGYVTEFMSYCQTNKLPLDFYSWHLYDIRNPQGIKAYADTVRTYLDRYGFTSAESIISEINPDLKNMSFQKDAKGAAWVIGAFITCNQAPVDKFFWYRGVQLNPLVEPDGANAGNLMWPGLGYKMYAAFLRENAKTTPVGGELTVQAAFDKDTTSLQALAGISQTKDTVSLLVSNLSSSISSLDIQFSNIPWNGNARVILTRLSNPVKGMVITESEVTVVNGKLTFKLSNAASPGAFLLRFIRKQSINNSVRILPQEAFDIYPNPASNQIEIISLMPMEEKVELQLLNMNGQLLDQKIFFGLNPNERRYLAVDHFPSGMYILRLLSRKRQWSRKIEIQH